MSDDSDPHSPDPTVLPAAAGAVARKGAVRPAPTATPAPKSEAAVRDARLKAALKANMARRKGQARARAGSDATNPSAVPPTETTK